MSDEEFLVKGMSPGDNKISAITLITKNMLTETLDNDEEGFYLIDYNKLNLNDKNTIKTHLLEIQKIDKERFDRCYILNDILDEIIYSIPPPP